MKVPFTFKFCLIFGVYVVDVLAGGPGFETSPSSMIKPRSRIEFDFKCISNNSVFLICKLYHVHTFA